VHYLLQVIPHNALINYTCSEERKDVVLSPNDFRLQCKLGRLVPHQPHCGSDLDTKKAIAAGFGNWLGLGSLDYSARYLDPGVWCGSQFDLPLYCSSHIFKNGDMDSVLSKSNELGNPLPSVAKLVDRSGSDDDYDEEGSSRKRANCLPPNRVDGSIIYRGDSREPMVGGSMVTFPTPLVQGC
jgi:hypothetical protein